MPNSTSATSARLYAVPDAHPSTERAGDYPDGAPAGPWTVETAYRYCERIATSHYENFPVASRFVPSHLRPHVWAIYAFARTADDFADEPRFEGRRRAALSTWERMLEDAYHREAEHPVFIALRDTVRRNNIPIKPFASLLAAFRADLSKHRYGSFNELRAYCANSANPVGQLVLYVHGHHEPELHRFSDEICSALQLANFLQDVSVDVPRGRCYLPEEDLHHFGVTFEELSRGDATEAFIELMRFSVSRVRMMFHRGQPLIRQVSPGLSMELEATWRGGMRILDRIESQGFNTLTERPVLERRDFASIAMRSLVAFGGRFLKGEA